MGLQPRLLALKFLPITLLPQLFEPTIELSKISSICPGWVHERNHLVIVILIPLQESVPIQSTLPEWLVKRKRTPFDLVYVRDFHYFFLVSQRLPHLCHDRLFA